MAPGLPYRIQQFVGNLSSRIQPLNLTSAQSFLPVSLFALFLKMEKADQAHSLRVFNALRHDGETDPDLLAAALLHDVGKAHVRPALWQRVLAALGEPLLKNRMTTLSNQPARGWRKAFIIAAAHPHWGAKMVAEAGGSDRLCRLIHYHQAQDLNGLPYDEVYLVRRLQTFDNRH
jgi:hypothetical protein